VATERPYRTALAGWVLAYVVGILPAVSRNEILHGAEKSAIGIPVIPHGALDAAFVGR
jgi:hypothetical protein